MAEVQCTWVLMVSDTALYLKSFLLSKHYFKVVSRSFPVGKAPVGFNLKPNVACKKTVPASLNIVDHVL